MLSPDTHKLVVNTDIYIYIKPNSGGVNGNFLDLNINVKS